jgi:hypothetical protein
MDTSQTHPTPLGDSLTAAGSWLGIAEARVRPCLPPAEPALPEPPEASWLQTLACAVDCVRCSA